ncbi:FGGY-family carbohydrate kinase [Acetobacterium sp. K1/6]|uniref:FGGY-family carbohydrate kinase n=1 Tax=Acetobacterium sp. K1/6 TaxID=3055467 RepID=UPI002ACAEE25|nr:FGGY-family carbohydrate kinase [Acetobacterium sp. K1/6]MDZ5726259.1 FGGY-family carbohydrate kinase [Acetobacterium sp. K1/6]
MNNTIKSIMKKNSVLTIDCGTRGLRGILFDEQGNELAKSEELFTGYYSKHFQWKEASPEMFWEALVKVVCELKVKQPDLFLTIRGMTVSCQRDVITVVDERGKPLRDFISWLDRRELTEPLPYPWPYDLLFKAIGFSGYAKSFSKTAHVNWIKVSEPDIWAKTHKVVFLSTYFLTRLTGNIADSRSNTAGHLPFDTKKKQWCGKYDVKSQILQMEPEKCYELTDSCEVIGKLTAEAAEITGLPVGLPIIASGTDKGCETLGVGALTPDIASISLGTQATVEITTKKYVELYPFYPAFAAVENDCYNPEVTIYHGFWMVDWYTKEFLDQTDPKDIHEILEGYLEATPPGADGLIHQPYWGREAFRPEARGTFMGFSEGHDKRHLYRAIIEGLGYALLEGLKLIERKTKVPIQAVGLSGGGSRSDGVAQIMADVLNRPVYRVQTFETTGLGAAIATFVGLNHYPDIKTASKAMIRKSQIFEPNPKNVIKYTEIYNRLYKQLYRRVKPLYQSYEKIR